MNVSELLSDEGNSICADCSAASPQWASLNNAVFICTQCSGVHRSLGVHVSFVQSVKMDAWTEHMVATMAAGGNTRVRNETSLEFHVPREYIKPGPGSSRELRERYITAKYAQKLFSPNETDRAEPLAPISESISDTVSAPASVGSVEFVGVLHVKLKACRNLINADVLGKSDPYVVFMLGRQKEVSRVIENNLNPVWNDRFIFSWDGQSKLLLRVWDKDYVTADDPIGQLDLDLVALGLRGGEESVDVDRPLEGVPHGSIHLNVSLDTFL